MPKLVQILLPVYDSAGSPFPANVYHKVRAKLTEKFGGLTIYSRAPAEGLWSKGSEVKRDDIIVFEVMAESLDRAWWTQFKRALERVFCQDEIVVRAQSYEAL
jgi:hypothetical protein